MVSRVDVKVIADLAVILGSSVSMYYLLKAIFGQNDSGLSADQKQRAYTAAGRMDPKVVSGLSEYEMKLLPNVIHPEEINSGFDDIGGLEHVVDELKESVLFPLTHMEQFENAPLLQAPKGVLLHGPPGVGKTMLAKALARESGANFINIQMSTLMDKWYGESNKIVAALFSLANKLKPCIIFIDEIDSFMRDRTSVDNEASATLKAEFMTWWDGLTTSSGGVLILGATNRPYDIDPAIMRRMPKQFEVRKPGPEQRRRILKILLENTPVDKNLDWDAVVAATEGSSGSDIKELCRDAAMRSMRELYRTHYKTGLPRGEAPKLRPLRTSDFVSTLSLD